MKTRKVVLAGLALLLVFAAERARSETISFPEVWHSVTRNSPSNEAANLQIRAAELGESRAARHWLPRLYLDARLFQTDDPAQAFVGLLEQRKVTASDFAPGALNEPGSQTFSRATLGLDLPLYEGGMKTSQHDLSRHVVESQKLGASQVELDQYSQAGLAYGSIASLRAQKAKLESLSEEISKLMRSYQLGQKSNPVGYSGLLGMKSLANRVAGLLAQLDAEEKASFAALREMGVQQNEWTPETIETRTFVDRYFAADRFLGEASFKSASGDEEVAAAEAGAKMERAKNLPRVGAFAESSVFNGTRDTANGSSVGLYLQWNLFEPSTSGAYREAKVKAMAAEKQARATLQQEKIEKSSLLETGRFLRENLARLEESDRLLAEQTRVSTTLFRNGSMPAPQFVEILNRRTDLIAQQTETELELLKSAATLVPKSKFEIPTEVQANAHKGDAK